MENGICGAFDCTNVIRGRRSNSKYCSNACKTRHSRHNKEMGVSSLPLGSSARVSKVTYSGNVVSDVATSTLNATVSNAITNKPLGANMGASALTAAVPYMGECAKKRPFVSLVVALLGYKASGSLSRSCTTTTADNGKKTKECTEASGLHRVGGSVGLVIAVNHLLDNWGTIRQNLVDIGSNVTDMKRYSNGTVTERNPFSQEVPLSSNGVTFFKAN